ncbi:unnamed protein product [Gongylonema pulchrum]|uniref:Uncharacterized protein n=1 Tax=Gongylonema pulchrum TaxID=637853 RepID=A0A183EFL9_9BILA|nr:unnamed protein product [Gongylonema pulchrum]
MTSARASESTEYPDTAKTELPVVDAHYFPSNSASQKLNTKGMWVWLAMIMKLREHCKGQKSIGTKAANGN